MPTEAYTQHLELFDAAVAAQTDFVRKGKTMPYTSANGHMFSLMNKVGDLGIRLPKERRNQLLKEYDTSLLESHNTVMKEYVRIPDELLEQTELITSLLQEGHEYVMSLPPKPTTKKKK